MSMLGISLGDPGGIGPEVSLRALDACGSDITPILFGSGSILAHPYHDALVGDWSIEKGWPQGAAKEKTAYLIDTGAVEITEGHDTAEQGASSFAAVEAACDAAKSGKIQSWVTAPISKRAWALAGISHNGHTEYLQAMSPETSVAMGFYAPQFSVLLHTVHIPFTEVPAHLTESKLKKTLALCLDFAKKLGINQPRIALAGLNPHAGESGQMGREEVEILQPFVQTHQSKEYSLSGPYPPDTVFMSANNGDYDLVIALYHDQGLIPVKLLAFDQAVNISIGLPYFRCSPDHGTAYPIAYQNKAKPSAMRAAIQAAIRYGA